MTTFTLVALSPGAITESKLSAGTITESALSAGAITESAATAGTLDPLYPKTTLDPSTTLYPTARAGFVALSAGAITLVAA